MILSADLVTPLADLAILAYLVAALPVSDDRPWAARGLLVAWVMHAAALLAGVGVLTGDHALRLGFGPVLSFTLWLVIAVYGIESSLLPVAPLRRALACGAAVSVAMAWYFPGEVLAVAHSRWAPLHWVLGVTSYGLFAVAVLHGLMLDAAERRLRSRRGPPVAMGLPLLKLERLTFRFVEGGFVVLTVALLLGLVSPNWRWLDHKTVLSLLGWATLAALITGRLWRGWRGRQATRWLYAGAGLLLLAYVGSRFVLQVLLHRPLPA